MARAKVHQFKHGPARISYTRFEGLPDPDQEPQVGDLAHIDGHWKVYSLSKTWLPAPSKTPHPDSVQLKTVNSVPKVLSEAGFWVSGSTYTNHLKLKGMVSASDEAQAVSPPTSKKRKMDHVPAEPTSGDCVNSWATELKKLYCKPPISPFPPSVLSFATQILQQLSQHSQPVPFLLCGPVLQPPSAPYPSTTLTLEDLLALGHDLISPDILGQGQSSTQEPVARFIERLACRHPSEKLAALMNIPATPRGLGQCMFQFTDMLATLGPGVAIRRNEDTFSQTDLQQLAPPPPVEPAAQPTNRKDIQKAIADRALFLEQLLHQEWVSTALCPPGWISPIHIDHTGLAEAIVHCGGDKLWLIWPLTVHNLAWWDLKHPAHVDFPSMLLAVQELEHWKVLRVTEPCSFIIPPFHLHAVLTFTLASHIGVSFAHPSFWTEAECGLLYVQKLIRNTRYPDSLKHHLVEQVLDERSIWECTGHKEALEGVDKWLEETHIIYEVIRSKEESEAPQTVGYMHVRLDTKRDAAPRYAATRTRHGASKSMCTCSGEQSELIDGSGNRCGAGVGTGARMEEMVRGSWSGKEGGRKVGGEQYKEQKENGKEGMASGSDTNAPESREVARVLRPRPDVEVREWASQHKHNGRQTSVGVEAMAVAKREATNTEICHVAVPLSWPGCRWDALSGRRRIGPPGKLCAREGEQRGDKCDEHPQALVAEGPCGDGETKPPLTSKLTLDVAKAGAQRRGRSGEGVGGEKVQGARGQVQAPGAWAGVSGVEGTLPANGARGGTGGVTGEAVRASIARARGARGRVGSSARGVDRGFWCGGTLPANGARGGTGGVAGEAARASVARTSRECGCGWKVRMPHSEVDYAGGQGSQSGEGLSAR
ncbi:hypothetical protein C8R44DRAFT_736629 [Mycena epipterygia]|nr:hypothetical protein C8R44DRAFT_736629 [Mycena epipterygia]